MSRAGAALLALATAGCALSGGYHEHPVVPPATAVGAGFRSDSARAFYDSLVRARAADSAPAAVVPIPPRPLRADSIADLQWLDILHDSTLVRLVDTALAHNRDLAAARARLQEFHAAAGVALAPLLPSVTLNGSGSTNQIAFGTTSFKYNALRVTADASWELDLFGGARRGLQAVHAEVAAGEAEERETVLALVADVAIGYLQLLELDQEQAVAERTLASRRATLDLANRRYAQGLISELDVRQFEAQVAVPAVRLAQVEQARALQEHALDVLLGEGPTAVPRGASLAQAAQAVIVPDSLPSSLLERRPDVRAAEREYAAATARIGVADAAHFPAILLTGSYGSQATDATNLFTKSAEIYQAQAGVSIPLFRGGALVNAGRLARAEADEARANYEQTALDALRDAGDALAGARAARDQAAAQETQARALRRAYDLAQSRYAAGVASYLEVLDAERSLFDAELALSEAQLATVTAAVRLYKALGGGWPSH